MPRPDLIAEVAGEAAYMPAIEMDSRGAADGALLNGNQRALDTSRVYLLGHPLLLRLDKLAAVDAAPAPVVAVLPASGGLGVQGRHFGLEIASAGEMEVDDFGVIHQAGAAAYCRCEVFTPDFADAAAFWAVRLVVVHLGFWHLNRTPCFLVVTN